MTYFRSSVAPGKTGEWHHNLQHPCLPALEQPGNCQLEIRSQKVRDVSAGDVKRSGELAGWSQAACPSPTTPPCRPENSGQIPSGCPISLDNTKALTWRGGGERAWAPALDHRLKPAGAGCSSSTARPALYLAFFHLCLNIQPVQPVWSEQAGASKHLNLPTHCQPLSDSLRKVISNKICPHPSTKK